ncbi:MAG: insulinase family protein, partial [Proteobacteria bacterium]|nr:insulinase family protein [Pseudomonadota bacterium]
MRPGILILPLLLGVIPRFSLYAAPAKSPIKAEILPLQVTEKTLANGLKVIVLPTGFPHLVSLQIPVKTGSRNEIEQGKTGFAHFFEHMMFRGTKTNPPEVYQAYLTKMGARQNAYTSGDYTNYHTTFAKDDLELMLSLEADRFQNLAYSESAFKTEARAVLGEYNKNSANPGSKLHEVTQDRAFTTHTYKHTTMGFIKDIEDMPNQYAYSKVFFDRWYRPENTSLIIAGDVDPNKVIRLVEKYWSAWQQGHYQAAIPVEPAAKGPIYAHVPWSSPTLPQLNISFRGPGFSTSNKDYAALDLFFQLAFSETSEVYKRLVIDEQKLNRLYGDGSRAQDPDLFTVSALVKEAKDVPYVRDTILKIFAEAAATPIPEQRLQAVRSNLRYAFARRLDNTESIASVLASYVRYERRFDTLNRYFSLLDTITATDVQKAAQKYFTDANLVTSTLSKDPLPVNTAEAPSLRSLLSTSKALNKLQAIVQKNSIPQLNIKLLFTAGSAQDPAGKEGLAALTAAMITDAGSQLYRFDELQNLLFPMAAGFENQVDKEMSSFTIQVHKDHVQRVLSLVLPSLLQPGLREDDFKRLKSLQLNGLKNNLRNNNEEELGKERLQELVYAGTPFGHPVIGTVKGIESITLDDVKNFIGKAYTQ